MVSTYCALNRIVATYSTLSVLIEHDMHIAQGATSHLIGSVRKTHESWTKYSWFYYSFYLRAVKRLNGKVGLTST